MTFLLVTLNVTVAQNNPAQPYWSFAEGAAKYSFYVEDRRSFTESGAIGFVGKIRYEIREGKKISREFLYFKTVCRSEVGSHGDLPKVAYFIDAERQTTGPVYTITAAKPAEPGAEEPYQLWQLLCSVAPSKENETKTAQAYDTYDNFDIFGGDFRKLENVQLNQCVSACQSDETCQAYSYDKWYRNCFLKNTLGPLLVEPSSTLGVKSGLRIAKSQSQTTIDVLAKKQFWGVALGLKTLATLDVCKQACSDEQQCLVFSYNAPKRECHLFSNTESFRSDPQVMSGMKRQPPPTQVALDATPTQPEIGKTMPTDASHSIRSITGRWQWKANCTNGPGGGIFHLRESSPSEFVGEFGKTNYWDQGTISNGKLKGNRITFVSNFATNRAWTAILTGSRMRGFFTGSGDCKFSAEKK